MDMDGENGRGIHAMRMLDGKKDFTLESLRDAAFDHRLRNLEDRVCGHEQFIG